MNKKEAYIQRINAELEGWHAKLHEMKAKAEAIAADKRIEYNDHIQGLEKYLDNANAKLDELQDAGEESWDRLSQDVEKAWHNASDAFNDAVRKYR